MRNKDGKERVFRFNSTPYIFTEELAQYLSDMAAEGYVFEGFSLFGLRFTLEQPQALKYWVDTLTERAFRPVYKTYKEWQEGYTAEQEERTEQLYKEYLDLCIESGWQLVAADNKMRVYCAPADSGAVPIHTTRSLN